MSEAAAGAAIVAPGDAVAEAEAGSRRAAMRRAWWLNAPALVILVLFAAGPLLVMRSIRSSRPAIMAA